MKQMNWIMARFLTLIGGICKVRLSIMLAILVLPCIYLIIWVSSWPNDKGTTWVEVLAVTAFILGVSAFFGLVEEVY